MLRLERAAVHLAEVDRELGDYQQRRPYRATALGTTPGLWEAHLVERPSPHLPIVVGDAVQNLRAALDQAAKALVPPRLRPRTQFPLLRDDVLARDPATGHYRLADNGARRARARWQSASEAIPGPARRFIESVQPYNHDERLARQLAVLGALWDADRQHTLAPVVTGIEEPVAILPLGYLALPQPFVLTQRQGNELVTFVARPSADPDTLPRVGQLHAARIEASTGRSPQGGSPEVEVSGVPQVAIELPDGDGLVPLADGLRDLWHAVRSIVHLLDAHAAAGPGRETRP